MTTFDYVFAGYLRQFGPFETADLITDIESKVDHSEGMAMVREAVLSAMKLNSLYALRIVLEYALREQVGSETWRGWVKMVVDAMAEASLRDVPADALLLTGNG